MASPRLRRLIDRAARYWAGEAEVIRTYFHSAGRDRVSDRAWLARQAFKEVWGSGLTARDTSMIEAWTRQLIDWFPRLDVEIERHEALELAEGLKAEFEHYCHFADAHDAMGLPGEQHLSPMAIRERNWTGDDRLSELRREHRDRHGAIGWRATRFTEGGYCTLQSEGMRLAEDPGGHEGRNRLIANACRPVYEDEFGHMLYGIAGLDREAMSEEDWERFSQLAIEQLRLRIPMRNEQFGFPLSPRRMAEIDAGRIEPLSFDYEKARLAA